MACLALDEYLGIVFIGCDKDLLKKISKIILTSDKDIKQKLQSRQFESLKLLHPALKVSEIMPTFP